MRRLLTIAAQTALLTAVAAPASAHDFWLQPTDFSPPEGAPVGVHVMIGHAGEAELWGAARERVTAFDSIGVNGTESRFDRLPPAVSAATLPVEDAGARFLTLTTSHAESELPADKFNEYAEDEGLTPALEHRMARDEMDRPGREIYSRRAKALLRFGDAAGANDAELITTPLGYRLEIVPDDDPYALSPDAPVSVQVIYEGEALPGARVHVGRLDLGEEAGSFLTDAEGRAEIAIPHEGSWVFNVVWTTPLGEHPTADFDTTFASLSFAFD